MDFWKRVDDLLIAQNISRKAFSFDLNLNESTISKGLNNPASSPPADIAVTIAQYLNTTVEYLVTGINSSQENYQDDHILSVLDKLSEKEFKKINKTIKSLSSQYKIVIYK